VAIADVNEAGLAETGKQVAALVGESNLLIGSHRCQQEGSSREPA